MTAATCALLYNYRPLLGVFIYQIARAQGKIGILPYWEELSQRAPLKGGGTWTGD